MSLRAQNRRLTGLASDMWLKEEEEDSEKNGFRVEGEFTMIVVNKKSPLINEKCAGYSDPVNILIHTNFESKSRNKKLMTNY